MLDLKYIRDNTQAVKDNIKARFMNADADEVVRLYEKRNALISEIDKLRQRRNENAQSMKAPLQPEERQKLIAEGKQLKESILAGETELEQAKAALETAAARIPNMAHPDAPIGKEEKDNGEISRFGTPPSFSFPPKDHIQLAEALNLIDFEAGAKVSGAKFYFLKNQAVLLELALVRYALDIVQKHGFTLTITPDIAREEIAAGIGFVPRGEESNIYVLEGTGTCLVGTAEITLGGIYAGDIIDLSGGPILLAGLSHCFRREAGASGQYSRGLYRVHQFTKVEMFAYTRAEESDAVHLKLRSIEEEIFQGLGIPYRIVDTCTGDLGAPAYRKFDIEAWMPGRGENGAWGEVTSTSNCTDYQARRLGIRYREEGGTRYAHTLNGTAIAASRAIIAILENGQQPDGSIRIPPALVPYCGFDVIPV
ncbi:MAG: serine--tRNA ligase [Spirochaeta sp. LUC14_002_19_P3]|nr:MAG: serine--tRNA ligase [Spirochaeta sp. LUC14_002_19_P3]